MATRGASLRHPLALGVVGFVLSLARTTAAVPMDPGPDGYPVALVLIAWPWHALAELDTAQDRPNDELPATT
ncbi:MAG: hypothetical protein ACREXW_16115 [Gammaproteobacteria bacterium]